MKRRALVIPTILFLSFFYSGSVLADDEAVYRGLSNFTKVLDLIERNYVEDVDSEKLTVGAIEGMLKTLDPYSAYLTPERFKELEIGTSGEFGGVGMEITAQDGVLTVISPIEGTPAAEAGIKPGDRIISIDGKPTQGMEVFEAVEMLRGPKGSTVKVTIRSEKEEGLREISLVRDVIRVKSVKSELLEDDVLYIKLSHFQENTSEELKGVLEKPESEKTSGLILDLRNNPGGLLNQAIDVADEFIDDGIIVSVRGRAEDESTEYYATKNKMPRDYPLVVLVNKGSASASEVVAEALQDNKRAVILGEKTFGKGSVQTIIRLEDGAGLKLTTAKFYAPNGRSINNVGVVPDVIVENGEDDKDLQLKRAKELLRSSASNKILSGR